MAGSATVGSAATIVARSSTTGAVGAAVSVAVPAPCVRTVEAGAATPVRLPEVAFATLREEVCEDAVDDRGPAFAASADPLLLAWLDEWSDDGVSAHATAVPL
ncbi:MAG: hypothetical protein KDB50_15635 [Mycobacterium sp.]|nr:hypothetical protein [Mycobacterium sp.]